MTLSTTFALAREYGACEPSYDKMAEALGGVDEYGDNTPFTLLQVLDVLGVHDAAWALRCVLPEQADDAERAARLFACECAEDVLPIFERENPDDKSPREAIEVARKFANGEATEEQLDAARAAAWDAARDAAWDAARAAARAAAWDAARDAAWAAARDAAWAAARAAAWDAARDAAWAAALNRQSTFMRRIIVSVRAPEEVAL